MVQGFRLFGKLAEAMPDDARVTVQSRDTIRTLVIWESADECVVELMKIGSNRTGARAGVSLVETLIAMLIVAVTIVATINGYILAANRAEWSAHSLAAHSLVLQRLEQVRAATWNLTGEFPVDQLLEANFPVVRSVLDLPQSGSNAVVAVVTTSISTVSVNPAVKSVRVDCVWPFRERGVFTNSIVTYRSPEQ